MKKITLLSALCILFISQIQAQNVHTWKMGPLTWNDFTPNTAIEKQVSHLEYYMGIENKSQEVDGVQYNKPVAYAYTTSEYSWVDTNYLSDQLLQYNQCIFDLVEVYRRRLEGKLQDSSIFSHGQLLDNNMRMLGDDVRRIELETNYGTDTAALHRWQNKIKERLNESLPTTPYGFVDAPFAWGMAFDLGYHYTGGQLNDYFRPGIGMSFNFELEYKRALFGSTIYMGGSKCRKDAPNVRNDYNDLYREDPLITLGLFGYCGYSIVDNNKTRLTPFVGFGLLGYYYTPEDEGSSMGSGNGCFHFGIIYNHIFHNQVSFWGLNNDYYNADHSKAYIDVRLYGTYNNFKSIVGAPQGFTLNLQVGIGLNGGRTHCK